MQTRESVAVRRHLGTLFGLGSATGLDDDQLLERFVVGRDEMAFAAIVTRHSPMVLSTCRRLLSCSADVDDAFQATFLSRLATARQKLQAQLSRRGYASVGVIASAFGWGRFATPPVPIALREATLTMARRAIHIGEVTGVGSVAGALGGFRVLNFVRASRLKLLGGLAIVLGIGVGGIGLSTRTVPATPRTNEPAEARLTSLPDLRGSSLGTAKEVNEVDPEAQSDTLPDVLAFGSVRVGATIEGSVRIFRESASLSGLAIRTDPPPFVRIREIKLGSQDYAGNVRGFCDIELSIDTERAGTLSGALRIEMGQQQVSIPVSARVRPQMPQLTRVLVVETPFHKCSTDDATVFGRWLKLVEEGHFDVHYLSPQHGMPVIDKVDLANIDVVLLGMSGLLFLQDSDITRLKEFVDKGGRLVVAANHWCMDSVPKANLLLEPYGLRMMDRESGRLGNIAIQANDIKEDPLTDRVKNLSFNRPSPVRVIDSKTAKLLVNVPGEPGEGYVAVARVKQGEVIALGQSLWWRWISNQSVDGEKNVPFLANLLAKPRP